MTCFQHRGHGHRDVQHRKRPFSPPTLCLPFTPFHSTHFPSFQHSHQTPQIPPLSSAWLLTAAISPSNPQDFGRKPSMHIDTSNSNAQVTLKRLQTTGGAKMNPGVNWQISQLTLPNMLMPIKLTVPCLLNALDSSQEFLVLQFYERFVQYPEQSTL